MKAQQNTLIYLIPYQLIPSHVEKFGFDIMREKKVPFRVFDLSAFAPHNHPNAKHDVILEADFIQKIASLKELDLAIRETAKNSIYIDCINGMNGILWSSRKIFAILKKYHAQYYVVEIGALPTFSASNKKTHLLSKIWHKVRISSNVFYFLIHAQAYIGKKIVSAYAKRQWKYQLPQKIFSIENTITKNYLSRYQLSQDTLIPIHSLDYDRYLTFIKNKTQDNNAQSICVFIDQCMAHHPELSDEAGLERPITAEKYFVSMRNFFDFFEKKLNLKIIIAAHPASQYEKFPGIFGDREIICNKTVELIDKSTYVLAHNSTAISNVVLFNKPLLLLTTQEMIQNGFSSLIDAVASTLQINVINIDEDFTNIDFVGIFSKKNHYKNYLHSYIKSQNVHDKLTWEFVAETLA